MKSVPPSPALLAAKPKTDFARAMEALNPDVSLWHPCARDAAMLVQQGHFERATELLRELLKRHPHDVSAPYLKAEIARRRGRYGEAEPLLARCVELAPEFNAYRFHYANVLLEVGKPVDGLTQAEELLKRDPSNPVFCALKAMALELLDEHAAAASLWREVVQNPVPLDCWVRYGHVLRVLGRREESIATCRKAIAIDPSFGQAYWALANSKPFRFSDVEIAQMETQVARPELSSANRIPLLFALGRAYADLELYEKSFGFYARGNALRRLGIKHDPGFLSSYVDRCKSVFTMDLFHTRADSGCRRPDPIFLVGMTRSGSTLVEQILASHSAVEGTRELFNLAAVAKHLESEVAPRLHVNYPEVLHALDVGELQVLGERYLESVRPYRPLGRPFFVDKMGNNFVHIGLLQLILPNAKIVDVRRHPVACGFSNFTQLYANGQNASYRLTDIGLLYRDYVVLMAHFDRVLPGRVHRVFYEQLVANPETEIRHLLAYLDLPFENSCLEFYKNGRAVSTVSSDQVRTPIYAHALEHWRHYEPWLAPLKTALGPIVDAYPDIPALD